MSDADEQQETVNKLQQITADTDTIEVGGVEFEIQPLTNSEFLNYISNRRNRNSEEVDHEEVTTDIMMKVLQKDDPNITREDFADAPMELTVKVMESIEQVNGLEDFFSKAESQMQSQQR